MNKLAPIAAVLLLIGCTPPSEVDRKLERCPAYGKILMGQLFGKSKITTEQLKARLQSFLDPCAALTSMICQRQHPGDSAACMDLDDDATPKELESPNGLLLPPNLENDMRASASNSPA